MSIEDSRGNETLRDLLEADYLLSVIPFPSPSYSDYEKRGDKWVIPGRPEYTYTHEETPKRKALIAKLEAIKGTEFAVATVLAHSEEGGECVECSNLLHNGVSGYEYDLEIPCYPCPEVLCVARYYNLTKTKTKTEPATPERLVDYDPSALGGGWSYKYRRVTEPETPEVVEPTEKLAQAPANFDIALSEDAKRALNGL